MRIGIVGGLERSASDLKSIARASGHDVELHTGGLAGPASAGFLRALVIRSDLVIVLTDVNSHNAVRMARRHARHSGVPVRLLRRLGPTQFTALLRGLGATAVDPEPEGRRPQDLALSPRFSDKRRRAAAA
jgi:Uncharacterized protein conserved in bacteria (DUF2325)